MFYLFLLTGVVINTIFTLSLTQVLLSWILLLLGYLVSDYLSVVKDVERTRAHLERNYAQKMDELRNEMMTAQLQKVKQTADQAAAKAKTKK